jgi:3-oxosteroid 1-dehydrogenase
MYPLSPTGPYYCVILGPGALDTKGGPITDEYARVLGVDGEPIPGLFGAGNCIASPAGQAYWGPGGTIGPAITFGYIAARTAVDPVVV